MDPIDVVSLTRTLIDIDSTTSREAAIGRWLARFLRERGYSVIEQPVSDDRCNLIASIDPPAVVFSTHMDCVPPFFSSREENGRLFGRGACDAKGILAAQIAAAERLRAGGARNIGLLFVVGEERGSDGAKAANAAATTSKFLVNGEPTDSRLGTATRGVLRLRFIATGRAAHSGYPELGESAIDKLIEALVALRSMRLEEDPVLGRTHYQVGLIAGGVAPNVVPDHADAEVLFRTVADANGIRSSISEVIRAVQIEEILEVPPVRLRTVPGFDQAAFAYTTDIPFLDRWGAPLLFGPGSVVVAHTNEEHVTLRELRDSVDHYARLATALLAAAQGSGLRA